MLAAIFCCHVKPLFFDVSFQNPAAFHHDYPAGTGVVVETVHDLYETEHPPLWILHQALGIPCISLYLAAVANPLVLLAMKFDVHTAAALLSFFNALLLSLFCYLFFLRAGASAWGSAAAGFLVALSGFFPWVSLIYPVALPMPWIICWVWSAMGLAEKPSFTRWLWNLLAVFMVFLSGDVQIAVEGAYLVSAWFLLWCWRQRVSLPVLGKSAALLALAAVGGVAAASVQMLPAIHYFSKVVNLRTPTIADYASTFPNFIHVLIASVAIFSRQLHNLFLPVLPLLLIVLAWFRKRSNPAFQASLILALLAAVLVVGGRSGLAVIPFHLPMLKGFIRHYKIALILQPLLFLGVALGFDHLIRVVSDRSKRWMVTASLFFLITLVLLPDNLWRALFAAAAVLFGAAIFAPALKKKSSLASLALFLVLVLDAGSYAFQTPYNIRLPEPHSLYRQYSKKAAPNYRVQGMYPWTITAKDEPWGVIPIFGTGWYDDNVIGSWPEFPLKNVAYFYLAITPRVAKYQEGAFSNVNFAGPFTSADFVKRENRHLINMAAVRYFFLYDMALSECDRFPILSDPAYHVNPRKKVPFGTWERIMCGKQECPSRLPSFRPALRQKGSAQFKYEHVFQPNDKLRSELFWTPWQGHNSFPQAASLVFRTENKSRLIFYRAVGKEGEGSLKTDEPLSLTSSCKGSLDLGVMPLPMEEKFATDHPQSPRFFWSDPQIRNPERTLKYLAGDKVMAFENTRAMGRARIVHQADTIGSDNQKALQIMRDPANYDPRKETLIMAKKAPEINALSSPDKGSARIVRSPNDVVKIKAKLSEPGYLVLADAYYPGWRAFDENGEELRVWRADLSMRAVKLAPGDHSVTFRFLPSDLRIGLWSTLAFIFCVCVLMVIRRTRDNR